MLESDRRHPNDNSAQDELSNILTSLNQMSVGLSPFYSDEKTEDTGRSRFRYENRIMGSWVVGLYKNQYNACFFCSLQIGHHELWQSLFLLMLRKGQSYILTSGRDIAS